MTRLQKKYQEEIVPAMMKKFGYKSIMQVPRFSKIVLNMTFADAVKNAKLLNAASDELTLLAGQKAVITKAKKAISNFKLRKGIPLGTCVTLRRDRMWTFFDRLATLALPVVRDFRGVSAKGFDGRGNYNMGLKEHIVFPEIDYDKVEHVRGMNITICTTAKTDEEGRALLEAFQFPFRAR